MLYEVITTPLDGYPDHVGKTFGGAAAGFQDPDATLPRQMRRIHVIDHGSEDRRQKSLKQCHGQGFRGKVRYPSSVFNDHLLLAFGEELGLKGSQPVGKFNIGSQYAEQFNADGGDVERRITSYNVCYTKLLRAGDAT